MPEFDPQSNHQKSNAVENKTARTMGMTFEQSRLIVRDEEDFNYPLLSSSFEPPVVNIHAGERIGWNVVLPVSSTRLWWLSDHLLMPAWSPYRKALSIGDLFIAGGAFWFLWSLADPERTTEQKRSLE